MHVGAKWGLLLFGALIGAGVYKALERPYESPPNLSPRAVESRVPTPVRPVAWQTLTRPWVVPPPAATPAPPAVRVAPPAQVAPPPLAADRSSVRYLGSMQPDEGGRRYLFKFVPTGLLLSLEVGQPQKGWTLVSVGEKEYVLEGPGGAYEAVR